MSPPRQWGEGGYDELVEDRWLYAMSEPGATIVKVGLVLDHQGLGRRLKQVRSKKKLPELELVAQSVIRSVNHEEAEHVEAFARYWLVKTQGFKFIGRVDWLQIPDAFEVGRMQSALDRAVDAARQLG